MGTSGEIMQESDVEYSWFSIVKEGQLTTIVCSVEYLLNNRPLTAPITDATDLEALTPNHFILRRYSIDYPNVVLFDGSAAMKKAFWAHSQFMKNIWDKWKKEVLPQLTMRKKWATEQK